MALPSFDCVLGRHRHFRAVRCRPARPAVDVAHCVDQGRDDRVHRAMHRTSQSVEDQIALLEVPSTIDLDEAVEIAKRRNHDLAHAVLGQEVVRGRVVLAGRVITVERAASAGLTSACTVVPVEIHDLVPRVDEVTHELLLSVI